MNLSIAPEVNWGFAARTEMLGYGHAWMGKRSWDRKLLNIFSPALNLLPLWEEMVRSQAEHTLRPDQG